MPRCCTHLIQPTILGCFHLMVRGSYRKVVIITERQSSLYIPSLYTVPERSGGKLRRWGIFSDWDSLLYRGWRRRRERYYSHFSEIAQLALLYLLSQEPKWNMPLKMRAHRKFPLVIPEIFRLPSDGTVILFMACAGLKWTRYSSRSASPSAHHLHWSHLVILRSRM